MMESAEKSGKILWTADVIAAYVGISRNKFYGLIKTGFPAVVIDGTWCSHTDNIEAFFRSKTAKVMSSIPQDAK